MGKLSINPSTIEVGIPITVVLESETKELSPFFQLKNPRGEVSLVRFRKDLGEKWAAQFALYEEGVYEVTAEDTYQEILVHRKGDLSFIVEFWGLALTTLLILGGLILWARKRRTI